MPKYKVDITYHTELFTFNTDNYEEFAKTKDELADKLDPTDPDAVHDFIAEQTDEDLMDFGLSPEVHTIQVFTEEQYKEDRAGKVGKGPSLLK